MRLLCVSWTGGVGGGVPVWPFDENCSSEWLHNGDVLLETGVKSKYYRSAQREKWFFTRFGLMLVSDFDIIKNTKVLA